MEHDKHIHQYTKYRGSGLLCLSSNQSFNQLNVTYDAPKSFKMFWGIKKDKKVVDMLPETGGISRASCMFKLTFLNVSW